MKIGAVVRALVSGVVVYGTVAACGAAQDASDGAGGASGGGGSSGASGGVLDAAIDALTDPVRDARADDAACSCAPRAPVVVEAKCDTPFTFQGAGAAQYFAVAQFNGYKAEQLVAVKVLTDYQTDPTTLRFFPPEYSQTIAAPSFVRDGEVAMNCGTTTANGGGVARVRFILP